jgi:cyclopropane-fatty-acyl-phospholipid synthase
MAASPVMAALLRLRHRLRPNTRAGARRNIAEHYDLGNEFYARWLDPTMTYSSAIFAEPGMPLEEAQRAKYRRVVETLGIAATDHVLEIGCGWGGFAEFAAKETGCRVTGLTLSRAQAEFAKARMERQGLADRVDIRIEDYRDVEGKFDKIASIEMFEAVGEENWPVYFKAVADKLKPGGAANVQTIVVADERFPTYRRNIDFIRRYIFPGGLLPSTARLKEEIARIGLRLADAHFFGESYVRTLTEWHRAFIARWREIAPLGFDERFKRMWAYYLCGCAASFRAKTTDVGQFLIQKT